MPPRPLRATLPRLAPLACALLLAACAGDAPPATDAALADGGAGRIEAHVRFLADDLLEGRDAGTRGYDIAALYVAAEFRQLGLAPGGEDGGYFQSVPMLKVERLREDARFEVEHDGQRRAFAFQDEWLPGANANAEQFSLSAPMVFVGQGVAAPEFEHDDFAGVEVRGRIAVLFGGAPASFEGDARAHHASGRQKAQALVERGAVGVIYLRDPKAEERGPWARGARGWAAPSMRLRGADGRALDTFPELVATASLSLEASRALLESAGRDPDAVFAALEAGELEAFEIPGLATIAGRARHSEVESRNVVAVLPGTDPALAREHVVFTAHLDHVGIGAEVDGDAIYNGALDNALGIGILLEAARQARASGTAPARSLAFVALTAEEKGLLGAEHFARNPSVDGPLVANLNMDMPVLLGDVDDAVPIGMEHSSLQAHVEAAAEALGMRLSPDPMPEENVFVRSDQYAFIRQGIPAVYMDGGVHLRGGAEDEGAAMLTGFLRTHYHQPSDDLSLPIHYPSAARLAELNREIGLRVANDPERPRWNDGDFFGERFGGGADGAASAD